MSRLARFALLVAIAFSPLVAIAAPALAGTQDFTLVNHTGIEIYALYISETTNDDWEEDVLGDAVLPDGERVAISFQGRSACFWDLMVEDGEDGSVEWTGIDLCKSSVVVLRCGDGECWAETE